MLRELDAMHDVAVGFERLEPAVSLLDRRVHWPPTPPEQRLDRWAQGRSAGPAAWTTATGYYRARIARL